jgi:hypothetical protein
VTGRVVDEQGVSRFGRKTVQGACVDAGIGLAYPISQDKTTSSAMSSSPVRIISAPM